MKVVDDRSTNLTHLCDIEFGRWFESNGSYYCRVSCEYKIDIWEDELLVMDTTGEIVGIARDKMVEPINMELHIVD